MHRVKVRGARQMQKGRTRNSNNFPSNPNLRNQQCPLKIVVEAPEIQNQAESPVLHPSWEPKDSVRRAQLGGPQHPPPILHISPGEPSVMGLGLVTQGS